MNGRPTQQIQPDDWSFIRKNSSHTSTFCSKKKCHHQPRDTISIVKWSTCKRNMWVLVMLIFQNLNGQWINTEIAMRPTLATIQHFVCLQSLRMKPLLAPDTTLLRKWLSRVVLHQQQLLQALTTPTATNHHSHLQFWRVFFVFWRWKTLLHVRIFLNEAQEWKSKAFNKRATTQKQTFAS